MNIHETIELALRHYHSGNLQQTEYFLKEALKDSPNDAVIMNLLGIVYARLGNDDLAEHYLVTSLQFDTTNADTYFALGNLLSGKGRNDEAVLYFRKALNLNPDIAEAYLHVADILLSQNLLDEAIPYYEKALRFFPRNADIYNNLGTIFHQKGKLGEALTFYEKAVEMNPSSASAYNGLGSILRYSGQLEEAITCYQKAIQINPEFPEVYLNIGNVFQDRGQLADAEKYYRKALEIKPDFLICYNNLLFLLNNDSRYDVQTIFNEHLLFSKRDEHPLQTTMRPHDNDPSPHRKLRVGYISPDFRRHAVGYFIEPVLSSHNHNNVEIFCYMNSQVHDDVTERIQKFSDHWRNISNMPDEKADKLVREDRIDILVDLAGHTANNRILLFARKPAPVQVSWIGYLATTGLSAMDYRIADAYTDPPGKTEQYYTEELVRMPESFLCYLSEKNSPAVGKLPVLTSGRITFGSFNKLTKVSQDVISTWSEILKAVPGSQLIIKAFSFFDKKSREYTIDRFVQKGIDAERIILLSWEPSPKHLESYNLVDIGLDTFPFNGATTTCEALWMGVPVITFAGTAYHSRAGASLLSNIGLTEMVAKTYNEYIEIAVNLSHNRKKLQFLRENLRDMMARSPLMDANRFAANLEDCYRKMWITWCSKYQSNRSQTEHHK